MTTKRQAGGVPAPDQINMVGEGTVFEGTLRADSDVRISGRVVGNLHVRGKVIVTQEGAVDGELVATNADVAGRVQGEVSVEERLMLKSSAHVDANLKTGRLVMEEGAVFNGDCQMGNVTSIRSEAPAQKPLRKAESSQEDLGATGS